jgi:carbamoyltransferase
VVVLGLWDGHDSGAAVLVDGELVAAANEERFTRRKLEITFPRHSLRWCLDCQGLNPSAVDLVATCTTDPAKALGRWFPSTKEQYYAVRRRKAEPGLAQRFTGLAKYRLTELRPGRLSAAASHWAVRRELRTVDLGATPLEIHDHHECHAACAFLGDVDPCVVLTIDGLGDGLSSSVTVLRDGQLRRIAATPATDSIGVFFERVTNLLNMRELEDEGKVMALADYATPVPDADNPMLKVLVADGLRFRTSVPGHALHGELKRIHWRYSNEQFAWMAQRAVEKAIVEVAAAAVAHTGLRTIALAGGVASNVKASRAVRMLPEVEDVYVFPHMGDGGLAAGAAVLASVRRGVPPRRPLTDPGLGPEFDAGQMEGALRVAGVPFERSADPAGAAACLIARGLVVLWFQGRMEYGPRALGYRSILARPDRTEIRDRLNRLLKRRAWYQPFCPSLLESDAREVLVDLKGRPNRHMTMAYLVAESARPRLAGVIGVDGSCRPQILADEDDSPYAKMLHALKRDTGTGAVLNTSFNIHGEPLVCTPEEAVDVFVRTGADALVLGPYVVKAR